MKIVFLGPPGAGKGTQAQKACERFKLAHISTGDILRSEIRSHSELGSSAQSYIDRGELVPDTLIVEIVRRRLTQSDCIGGFVLDGFPRTLAQADALDEFITLDKVIDIGVPLEKLADRLSARRVCIDCGATLSVHSLESPTSPCPACSGRLILRDDDKRETVMNRLNVYQAQTAPLIDYYKSQGKLLSIDGDRDIEAVYADVCAALER